MKKIKKRGINMKCGAKRFLFHIELHDEQKTVPVSAMTPVSE